MCIRDRLSPGTAAAAAAAGRTRVLFRRCFCPSLLLAFPSMERLPLPMLRRGSGHELSGSIVGDHNNRHLCDAAVDLATCRHRCSCCCCCCCCCCCHCCCCQHRFDEKNPPGSPTFIGRGGAMCCHAASWHFMLQQGGTYCCEHTRWPGIVREVPKANQNVFFHTKPRKMWKC